MTVIIFLIVLAVLIFVHELGHFLTARLCNIRVDAFKLGFGPRIFHWKKGETEYGLNLIPFGGYVKIFGENPDSESTHGPDSKRSFVNKPKWQQITILAAGVLFNFIFAWALYVITFVSGVTATTAGFGQYADEFENPRVMISYVSPDSPADKADLKLGDMVIGVLGPTPVREETTIIKEVEGIQDTINKSQGTAIEMKIERQGIAQSLSIYPVQGLVEGKYAIGIAMENVGDLKLPFLAALKEGTRYFGVMFKGTAVGLWNFFGSVFRGTANFSDVAGPVGIATIVGDFAQLGMAYLFMITAIISINLGIINLVPFPALDGGRIFFIIIESIIRRRIPMKFTNVVNAVGFALLMFLMVIVTYKDVVRLIK